MKTNALIDRLAVCSWSLQAQTPEILAERISLTGIPRVQLALDPLYDSPAVWGKTANFLLSKDISIISGMVGCVGEDYTTLDTIRVTGGIAPDSTWEQNRKDLAGKAKLAADLGMTLVTFHAGFLPHDQNDPSFAKLVDRVREVADQFAEHKITLSMETGQETAEDLAQVLKAIDRSNLGVNFDPANMILYAKGDPIQAVRTLGPWIRQVHIKDAKATQVRGTWGEEVPVGKGDVNWSAFCSTLSDVGYKENLVIEREAGTDRIADIRTARQMLEQVFAQLDNASPATL